MGEELKNEKPNGMGPGTPPPPGYMNGGMGVPPQGIVP